MRIHPAGPSCTDMTLLDYFAGQALTGLLAETWHPAEQQASHAYQIAEAMIAARDEWAKARGEARGEA